MYYNFQYNIPADNTWSEKPDHYITVNAEYAPITDSIVVDFHYLTAIHLIDVRDWCKVINDCRAIARTEFEQLTAISETSKIVNAA